jgi:hypothetical protein
VYGAKKDLPGELLDILGHLHGALKTPAKISEFERGLAKRLQWAAEQGLDISDPVVQTTQAVGALADAQRAIFMQDNIVSNMFSGLMRMLENNKIAPGLGKALAAGGRFIFPVTKVAPNIVTETLNISAGSLTATARLLHAALTKGLDELTPDEADQILRGYKKQGIGVAIAIIGAILAAKGLLEIGGYYIRGEKRKPGEVQAGRIRVAGIDIPVWATHTPYFEQLQIGATLYRVSQAYRHKGKDDEATGAALYHAGLGLAEEIPFYEEPIRAAKATEGYEGGKKYVGDLARGFIVPPDVQRAARVFDPSKPTSTFEKAKEMTGFKTAEPVKRTPKTIFQNLETGIPGLRKNVPSVGHGRLQNREVAAALSGVADTDASLLGISTKDPELDSTIQRHIMERVEKMSIPQGATDLGREKIMRDRLQQIRAFAKADAALEDPKRYRQYLQQQDAEFGFLTDAEKSHLTPEDITKYRTIYADDYLNRLKIVTAKPQYQAKDDDTKEKMLASIQRASSMAARVQFTKSVRPKK